MNNLMTLIKANMLNSWGFNKMLKSKSKGEKIKAILLGIVIVYAFCMIFASMFFMNIPLAQGLEKLNALDILLSSSILSVTVFSLFMSIFKLPSYLFAFRDYDLLMSLPVKPSTVLTSKLIFIYLSNLLIANIVTIPPLIIYGYKTTAGILYYIFTVTVTLFIPLIPISIGAVIAYFLGRISTRIRSTNLIMIVGSLLLCAILIVGSPMINQLNSQHIQGALPVFNSINTILFWIDFYIKALRDSSVFYLIMFVAFSTLVFTVFIAVLSKGFKTINSRMSEKYKSSDYKMTRLKASSPLKALFVKELRFYFSSFIYVTNTAIGPLMMTVFSIAIIILGKDKLAKLLEMPFAGDYIYLSSVAVFAFCIGMTLITASSISLEGKNLWIIKSLPVDIKSILWSKVLVNLALTVPALVINMIIIVIGLELDITTALAMFAVLLTLSLLSPVIGLMINLYFPKLEWTSHMAVVKQSVSVFISMLANFVIIIITIVLFVAIEPSNANVFLFATAFVLLLVTLVFVKVLKTIGVRRFAELQN